MTSPHAAEPAPPVTVIRPATGWQALNLREIWDYRELLWFLALRDTSVRYKQTLLGVLWAVLQPTLTMIAFSVFFGSLGGLDRTVPAQVSYAVFTLAGLLPWQFFAFSLNAAGQSLTQNQALITKVYCPRLILPVAAIVPGLVDFAASFIVLCLLMAYQHTAFHWPSLLLAPVLLVPAVLASLAVGIWLAILSAEYRDARHTLQFLTQLWLLATPVAYPSSVIPPAWRGVYGLNPMATVVESFRWAMLGTPAPGFGMGLSSATITAFLLLGALFYFRRTERLLADVL